MGPHEPARRGELGGPSDRSRTVRGLVLVAVLAIVAGYLLGQSRAGVQEADVSCSPGVRTILCGPRDEPGRAAYRVPLDVAWTAGGVFHEDGRPSCLRPRGRGLVPVRVTWTAVQVGGRSFQQVVGVHC